MNTLLIRNGRVIDGTGAPPRAESVLIEGEKIVALGADADARAQGRTNVGVLDAKGMTVMPGLIDGHCHLSFDEPNSNDELFNHRRHALAAIAAAYNAKKLVRAGVTGILDPDSIFELSIDLRDAIDAGLCEGPRVRTGSYALWTSLGGTAGRLIPDHGIAGYGKVVSGRDEIVAETRRQIKMGADWIKIHVTGLVPRHPLGGEQKSWTLDELKAVCDTAHELGIPVQGHCRGAASVIDCVKAGMDLILHATYMDEHALELVIDRKVPVMPVFTFQANLADYGAAIGADATVREMFRLEISDNAAMLRRAYDAGVPLLCGSESGFSITPYGDWHHREMEVFVRDLGLTPLQAIQCATQANAFAMRAVGKLGEIAPGRLADILVVDGDPSRDISVLGQKERIKHVFIGGRAMDLSPLPPRKDPTGWRVVNYGARLGWDVAHGKAEVAHERIPDHEL
ncbi:MAG: amidohydrolase family protein [Steroidobacteraceae bacterium]|jgi:imidazolonepropionase-like amidohydrolase|nr:amidohydrolase family protein [Steroidobacteraceae bacterium]